MKKLFFDKFLVTALFLPLIVFSQTIPPKQYITLEISPDNAPKIDGFLDESIWDMTEWGADFVEVNPDETPLQRNKQNSKFYTIKSIYTLQFWL